MNPQRRNTRVILSFALAAALSACSSPQPESKIETPAAPKTISAEERVKWYQECWSDFNDKKWDDFKKCYADNATSVQGGYGKSSVTGADAIVESSKDFAKSFPDGRGEGQIILVNGNHVAGIYLLKGTNTGPMTGPDGKETAPTNKKFGLLFGHAVEMDPNALKVTKDIGILDGGTLAAQLGLMKMPARPLMESGEAMPKIVIAKNDDAERKNLDTEKAQWEAWNKHDGPAVDSYEADDIVVHDMTSPKDQNKAQGSQGNKAFWSGFSDAKLTYDQWAAGDYVATTGSFEGTNDGDFAPMKLKKTGKKVSVPYFEIDRLENGKIKETWLIFDTANFAMQLGK